MFKIKFKSLFLYSLFICCFTCACHDSSEASKKTPPPPELVGEWYIGSISSIQYVDRYTGVFKPTVGLGGGYNIKPDGSYVGNTLVQSRVLGADFVYVEGRVNVTGDRLTFQQTKRIVMHKGSGATTWTKKAGKTSSKSYIWRIDDTKAALCLRDADGGDTREACYRKQ